MPMTFDHLGRVQRKFLPCGVPLDPDSCPCHKVEVIPGSSADDEPFGKGHREDTPAGSCRSLNKLSTDNVEISIYVDRLFSIFCRTLKKLELSASLHALLKQPDLPHVLNEEEFRTVTNAFRQYFIIKPCDWRNCSESTEASMFGEESLESSHSSLNQSGSNSMIYEALQILNNYSEVREMVKLLRSEYSEQAQLFLEYVKSLMNHSLKRIYTSPEESRAKELHYRNLWRDNEKAKADLRLLTLALDDQRKKNDAEMELTNAQCEKDSETVKRIDRKCKEDIRHTVMRSEKNMMMMYKASELRQKEMQEVVDNAEARLKSIRSLNLALEKEARDKRFKIESQLLGVINKFDTEIGEQQKQMEELIEEYETDKKNKEEVEAEIERQAEMFDAFQKEKQEALDAMINEKLAKIMLLRAVKIIQRWYRTMRAIRKANSAKKKKKNKKNKKKK